MGMPSTLDTFARWPTLQPNIKQGADFGLSFRVRAHSSRNVMRQSDSDCNSIAGTGKGFHFTNKPGPFRVGRQIIDRPEAPTSGPLFDLNVLARFDVEQGTNGKGKRNMCVKHNAQVVGCAGSLKDEGFQIGSRRPFQAAGSRL